MAGFVALVIEGAQTDPPLHTSLLQGHLAKRLCQSGQAEHEGGPDHAFGPPFGQGGLVVAEAVGGVHAGEQPDAGTRIEIELDRHVD